MLPTSPSSCSPVFGLTGLTPVFAPRSNSSRLVRLPIQAPRVPVRKFVPRPKRRRPVRALNALGMLPLIQLFAGEAGVREGTKDDGVQVGEAVISCRG